MNKDESNIQISEKRIRFFGNECLGDGFCPRVYLGDTFKHVSSLIMEMSDELNEWLENGGEIKIWTEILTDEEVEALPDL